MTYITIESDEIEKFKKELKLKIISENNNSVKFLNNKQPNELINKIGKFSINKILIEEAPIEDIVMEYYK